MFYRDFDVEGDSQDCPDDSDFTEVYNGIASWSKIIGRYCGSVIPPAITSDSNKLRIEFHSNTQYAGRGFDAVYSLKAIGEQGNYVCYLFIYFFLPFHSVDFKILVLLCCFIVFVFDG